MATYATQADFEAYVEGWVTDNPATLERLLEQAEDDLDNSVFVRWPRRAGQPRVELSLVDPEDLEALTAATCAQAHYRFVMGPDHFVRAQRQKVTRRGVALEGTLPIIGPQAIRELQGTRLLQLTSFTGGRRWDPDEMWRRS